MMSSYVDYTYSNSVENQVTYATVTRDIYELCEVESSGFCTGVCFIVAWL